MANIIYMQEQFESKKNLKAGGYTVGIIVLMLVMFLFIKWTLPPLPTLPVEEGIEVNLGSSDEGLGTDQPLSPGQPSPRLMDTPELPVPPEPV